MPRRSSSWSKEFDVRFVRAVREELSGGPSEGVVRHQETSEGGKTVIPWDSILSRLRSTSHWPEDISTTEDLKKRWDMTFRIWYARAGLFEAEDPNKSRASVIRLSKLIDYLKNRDYEVESKPGRKKSVTPVKKRKEKEESFEEEVDEDGNSGEEEEEENEEEEEEQEEKEVESQKLYSSPPQVTPPKKRSKMETTTIIRKSPISMDPRLEPWFEFLNNPRLVKAFRIHSHSEVVIEPQSLFDSIVNGTSLTGTTIIISFARAIAPTVEWAKRIVDVADEKTIRNYLTEKVSFFLFSSKTIHISGQRLLFSLVFFAPHVDQDSQSTSLWTLFQDTNDSGVVPDDKSHRLEILKAIGLPQENLGEVQFRNEVVRSTSPPLIVALGRFHDCLNKLVSSQSPRVMDIWPGEERIKNEILSAILLSPHVSIRAAPFIEPPALPFKSIIEAIKSLIGVSVPAWCNAFPPDHRDSLLCAIRDLAKTVVLIANLKVDQSLTWDRNPEDKEVLLLVEEAGQFGGILRLTKLSTTSASLSILVKTSSIQSLFINHRSYPLEERVEHQVELQPSLQISVTLAGDVKLSLLEAKQKV